jgi:hypothetical protein
MNNRQAELDAFKKGLEDYVFPTAKAAGLICEKIDEELYSLVAPTFALKFYCAGGLGYSYGVTVSPTYQPKWNAEDERGLTWLAKYLKKKMPENSRFDNLKIFVRHMADLSKQLPDYFEILKAADSSFWKTFLNDVQEEISKKPKPDWWDWIQKLNVSSRQRAF